MPSSFGGRSRLFWISKRAPLACQAGSTRLRALVASMIGSFFGKQVIPHQHRAAPSFRSWFGAAASPAGHNSLDCY